MDRANRNFSAGVALEFTATECVRPDLFGRALRSFHENLRGVDWKGSTLYLNVDPVPDDGDPWDVVRVAKKYFGRVVPRLPDEPNFAMAVKWCWWQVQGEYCFHLEGDWELTERTSLRYVMARLGVAWDWAAVNLRAYRSNMGERLCLSPGLIRGRVVRDLARRLNITDNPEAQLRAPEFREGGRSLGVHLKSEHWPDDVVVKDIGRAWMQYKGLAKAGGQNFVRWVSLAEEAETAVPA